MKKVMFVLVVCAIVMITANAYAPLVMHVDESKANQSSNQDTSTVDLSDKTSDVVYSPSLENE